MLSTIKQLVTGTCNPNMKGCKLYWEWNWPHRLIGNWNTVWFEFGIRTTNNGDHSPGAHCTFIIFNWCLLDFGYYNMFHENDDDDEEDFK
jgi:hypothetical protein